MKYQVDSMYKQTLGASGYKALRDLEMAKCNARLADTGETITTGRPYCRMPSPPLQLQ